MFEKYAANPQNRAARSTLRKFRFAEQAVYLVGITGALSSMVRMLVTTRPPLEDGWIALSIYGFHVFAMGAGFLLLVGGGLLVGLRWFLRHHLEDGSILRLDQSIVSLQIRYDARGREIPLTDDDRFGIQRDFNASLETRCGDKAPGI